MLYRRGENYYIVFTNIRGYLQRSRINYFQHGAVDQTRSIGFKSNNDIQEGKLAVMRIIHYWIRQVREIVEPTE